jgi:type III secretory pathway component EscR
MQKDHIKAIQETIAGFLHEQVINPNDEFHFNGNETLIANNDDHLEKKNSMYICVTNFVLIKLYKAFYIFIYLIIDVAYSFYYRQSLIIKLSL